MRYQKKYPSALVEVVHSGSGPGPLLFDFVVGTRNKYDCFGVQWNFEKGIGEEEKEGHRHYPQEHEVVVLEAPRCHHNSLSYVFAAAAAAAAAPEDGLDV